MSGCNNFNHFREVVVKVITCHILFNILIVIFNYFILLYMPNLSKNVIMLQTV